MNDATLHPDLSARLGDFGISGDGSAMGYRRLDLSAIGLEDVTEILSCFPLVQCLDVSDNQLTASSVRAILSLPFLYTLNMSNCSLGSSAVGWHDFPVAPLLSSLDISHNDISGFPNLRFCPHLQYLTCSHNRLTGLGASFSALRFLRTLNISHNRLATLKQGADPAVRMDTLVAIDASSNLLLSDEHVDMYPNLRALDLSCNRIATLKHLSARHTPYLTSLHIYRNSINNATCFRRLVAFKMLHDLRVLADEVLSESLQAYRASKRPAGSGGADGLGDDSSDDSFAGFGPGKSAHSDSDSADATQRGAAKEYTEDNDCMHAYIDLKDARFLVLGDLLSRSDEVADAIGMNKAQDPFPAAPSASKPLFERAKESALATLPAPTNSVRAFFLCLLPQVGLLNEVPVSADERIRARDWLDPPATYLAMREALIY